MIEHRCEYKYTALVHTDACLGFITIFVPVVISPGALHYESKFLFYQKILVLHKY